MSIGALVAELDRWSDAGRRATLWLRDDDACSRTQALDRLLSAAVSHDIALGLATIPAQLHPSLPDAVAGAAQVTVLQHGFAHANHAAAGARSAELGADRPTSVTLEELERGRELLQKTFDARFLPVLVPPWNRIAPEVVAGLPAAGFFGVSTFAPRGSREAAPGLRCCNAHVDLIAWRRDRAFIGADAAAARIASHLSARRVGACDADEATGILTHHLQMDDPAWAFLDLMFTVTRAHPAAHWLDARAAFSQ
jgi:hypothetical protein